MNGGPTRAQLVAYAQAFNAVSEPLRRAPVSRDIRIEGAVKYLLQLHGDTLGALGVQQEPSLPPEAMAEVIAVEAVGMPAVRLSQRPSPGQTAGVDS
jgi:hypothetical protein